MGGWDRGDEWSGGDGAGEDGVAGAVIGALTVSVSVVGECDAGCGWREGAGRRDVTGRWRDANWYCGIDIVVRSKTSVGGGREIGALGHRALWTCMTRITVASIASPLAILSRYTFFLEIPLAQFFNPLLFLSFTAILEDAAYEAEST